MTDVCIGENCHKTGDSLNTLVLNDGELWLDFCDDCGSQETVVNENTGEEVTLMELFNRSEKVGPA